MKKTDVEQYSSDSLKVFLLVVGIATSQYSSITSSCHEQSENANKVWYRLH